jgi:hypothetical protein
MTKKNSKKRAARDLQQRHGGSYQHHLRSVGGAEGGDATPRSPIQELPHFRHVYLRQPIDFEIDVFTMDQSASWFVAKFDTGWSNTVHRLEPVYHRASWAQDAPATERELRALARRAIQHVETAGFVLVVHAPGKLAMMWSDHELPREGLNSTFGPSLRAVPYQPIEDGPPPPWWPAHEVTKTSEEKAESKGLLDPASHHVFMLKQLYEAAEDILHEHPEGPSFLATVLAYTLPDRSTPFVPMVPTTAMKFMNDAPRWYFDGWLAFVDGELYEGNRPVREDMLSTVAGRTRLADILVKQIEGEAPWLRMRLKSFEVKRGYAYANNLRVEVALSFVDRQASPNQVPPGRQDRCMSRACRDAPLGHDRG